MKDKTKTIKSWDELIKFVGNCNPYTTAIFISGFTNEFDGEKLIIRNLVFTSTNISLIKERATKRIKGD